jgi:hypothetical protein
MNNLMQQKKTREQVVDSRTNKVSPSDQFYSLVAVPAYSLTSQLAKNGNGREVDPQISLPHARARS